MSTHTRPRKHAVFSIVITALIMIVALTGCKQEPEAETVRYGSISGKALYSNGSNHAGILLTLDRTDGLRAISTDDGSKTVEGICYSQEDGSFGFYNLTPGTYTVYASSNNSLEKAVSTNVYVAEGKAVTITDLNLTATGTISGKLLIDSNSTGNEGFLVFVAGTSYMAATDGNGKFSITGIPAGADYPIIASKGNFTISVGVCDVTALGTTTMQTVAVSSDDILSGNNSVIWKGSYSSESVLVNPRTNWAYFNITDGCSYIYNGSSWTLLASKGEKGETGAQGQKGDKGNSGTSITWKGSLGSAPSNPDLYWAYFNAGDGCSYIWDGTNWTLLAQKGAQGIQGATGAQGLKGDKGDTGLDGMSINWLGTLDDFPSEPEYLDCFFHNSLGFSVIFNGREWDVLASPGADGQDGASLSWRGSFNSAPENPELNWAYFNNNDGCSYIWDGVKWTLLALKGATGETGLSGASVTWLGELSEAPADPQMLYAYFNTSDGNSYIFNGESWDYLALKGDKGDTGETGASMSWRGELSSAPSNPQPLWAYYNTSTGNSYIYNGSTWTLLAQKGATGATGETGADGTSVIWKGELGSAPSNPQLLWAYYNTADGRSYIYNGSSWDRLSEKGDKGDTGEDGRSLIWKGDLAAAPSGPQSLWAYHNTADGNSYIYYNGSWSILAEKGDQGHTLIVDVAVAPTCTETGLTAGAHCVFCGYVHEEQAVIPATGHTAVEDPAVAATCTETGLTRGYHCSVCGEIILPRRTVEALGHTPVVDAAVAPTCTENGLVQGSHCSVCGAVIVAQEVAPATGHTPVVDPAVAPTCHSFGYTEGSHCETCGYVIQVQTPIAMTEHSLINTTVAPTCLEQGYDLHTCENCDYENRDNYVDALGHDYDEGVETTPATCTDDGVLTITCQRCGHSFTSIIPKIGGEHEWETTWSADDDHHYLKCQHCSAGINYTEHSYDQVIVTTAATCTTDGERTYTCSVCGHVKHEVIPATGHDYSIVTTVAPTCTDRGYTSHVCSHCGDEQRDNYTEALGHSWSDEWVSDGTKHWHECERCGLATTKLDHTWLPGVVTEVSCTHDGYVTHTCEICGYHYDDNHQDMLGHDYDAGNICTRCGYNRWQDNFTISGTTLTSFDGTGVTGVVSIPDGVTEIGEGAFTGCTGITGIIIPDSVTIIGYRAFARCSGIAELTIPDSVQSMGNAALYGCTGLQSLSIPFIGSSRTADGTSDSVFGYIFGTNYFAGSTSTVQIYSADGSGTYYIPSSLRSVNVTDADMIHYGAFSNCAALTSVSIGDGILAIGKHAFDGDTVLETVTIADGIRTIDDYAFQNCSCLTSVTLPSSIKAKGHGLFYGCDSLDGVFWIDVPVSWDTTNEIGIDKASGGFAEARFSGSYSDGSFDWYIDDDNVTNLDGTPVPAEQYLIFGRSFVQLPVGNHVFKCVATIDGDTYVDTCSVYIVDSDGINAEGYVFYDKGSYSDGWRYLQTAPADLRVIDGVPTVDSTADGYSSASTGYVYGYYRTSSGGSNTAVGTNTNIGTGKANTNALVTKMGESAYYGSSKTANYAARLCYILEYAGYDDWFLPSNDELNLMYTNLKQTGLGGFADATYWSSSENDCDYAWKQNFFNGGRSPSYRVNENMVRPVRAF